MAEELFPNYKRNLTKRCLKFGIPLTAGFAIFSFLSLWGTPLAALGCSLLTPAIFIIICFTRLKRAKAVTVDYDDGTVTIGGYGTKPLQELTWANLKIRGGLSPENSDTIISVGFDPRQKSTFIFHLLMSPLSDKDLNPLSNIVEASGIDPDVFLI